jgi:NAD(P)-dependent dehydrogenase (short-subunit alcohol dehydrogenase family)
MGGGSGLADELKGKVALVVGGASGIGFAAAALMAQRGARVLILADQGVDEAVARAAQLGVAIDGLTGDASDTEVVRAAVQRAASASGGLHITVHTAVIHPYGNAVDTSEATWDRVMAVNVRSVFLLAHHALPLMLAQGEGAIVNVASVQATSCQRDVSAYTTSKAAILGFTRSLAVDYSGRGIRANAVSPGPIRTPLLDLSVEKFGNGRPKEEVFAGWGKGVPMGRIGEADEVAEVIAFAVSARASYCSGSEFVVDGGTLVKSGI